MTPDSDFHTLIAQVRLGNEQAAAELVRRYEKALRVAVRVRLTDPGLRRLLDSTDICQSVLASFFVRAASGQYDLETPEQLLKLLTTMARNKLVNHAQSQQAARRDHRRVQGGLGDAGEVAAPEPSPSQVVAHRELLRAVRQRMSAEERRLADLRAQGCSWVAIAEQVGEQPNTLRTRFGRALDRVTRELGLEE